jgi:hypothetical protein
MDVNTFLKSNRINPVDWVGSATNLVEVNFVDLLQKHSLIVQKECLESLYNCMLSGPSMDNPFEWKRVVKLRIDNLNEEINK